MISAATLSVLVDVDAKKGTATLVGFDQTLKGSAANAESLAKTFDKTGGSIRKTSTDIDRSKSSWSAFSKNVITANQGLSLLSKTIRLIKWPAILAALGAAAEAAAAAAGGVAALAGALAPLAGLAGAATNALIAFGQVGAVAALSGVKEIGEAIGGLNEKMDKQADAYKQLTPRAQKFARTVNQLKQPIQELQKSVQRPLFKGLTDGLELAKDILPTLRPVLMSTSRILGQAAERVGKFIGSEAFGKDLRKVGESNNKVLARMGDVAVNLGKAFMDIAVAARPLTQWIGQLAERWSEIVKQWAASGRESGRLSSFFNRTKEVTQDLIGILKGLGGALANIVHQGAPLGRQIIDRLREGAQWLKRWTESTRGKNSIAKFFKEIRAPLFQAGKLIRDIGAGFFEIQKKTQGMLGPLIKQIRKELLPVFIDVIASTSKAFGPKLISLLTSFAKLVGTLAGTNGPLNVWAEVMTKIIESLNWLLEHIPGLKEVVTTLLGMKAVMGAMNFVGAATGIKALAGRFGMLGAAATGAATKIVAANKAISTSQAFAAGPAGAGKFGGAPAIAATTVPTAASMGSKLKALGPKLAGIASGVGSRLGGALSAGIAAQVVGSQVKGEIGDAISNIGTGAAAGFAAYGPWGAAAGAAIGVVKQVWDQESLGEDLANDVAEDFAAAAPAIGRELEAENVKALQRRRKETLRQIAEATGEQTIDVVPGVSADVYPDAIVEGADRDGEAIQKLLGDLRQLNRQIGDIRAPKIDLAKSFRQLSSGVFASGKDIERIVGRNSKQINDMFQKGEIGVRKFRAKTAENLRAGAVAAEKAYKRGDISLKRSLELREKYIREADLVDPTQKMARQMGREWANGLDASKEITRKGVDKMINELAKMPPKMRQIGADQAFEHLHAAKKAGDITGKEYRRMRSRILTETEGIKKGTGQHMNEMTGTVTSIVGGMVNTVSGPAGYQTLVANTNSALKAMGVKEKIEWTPQKAKGGGSGGGKPAEGPSGKQRGGPIGGQVGLVPGVGTGDKVHALLEPGEVVVNRKAVAALGGAERVDQINKEIPRFQRGGVAGELAFALGPYDIPPIQYDADHAGGNSHWHISGTPPSWVVAVGHQLQDMGFQVGEHPAFGGVAPGVHGNYGPTDHYHGGAIDVNSAANETRAETAKVAQLLGGAISGAAGAVVEKIKGLTLEGPEGPLKDLGQAGLDKVHAAANKFLAKKAPAETAGSGGLLTGSGDVEKVFAETAKKLSRSRVATLALGEAGYAESGMQDLAGGDSSSSGALQLLASTASSSGIDPHDEAAIASSFLNDGYGMGKGANQFAAQGLPAHMVAQSVQRSAFSDGSNYLAQRSAAESWMSRYNLSRGGIVGMQKGGTLLVGDSITEPIKGKFPSGWDVIAEGAKDSAWGVDQLSKWDEDKYLSLAFMLGTNDAKASDLRGSLGKVKNKLDKKPGLALMTFPEKADDVEAKNQLVKGFNRADALAKIEGVPLEDGFHPTSSGSETFRQRIKDAGEKAKGKAKERYGPDDDGGRHPDGPEQVPDIKGGKPGSFKNVFDWREFREMFLPLEEQASQKLLTRDAVERIKRTTGLGFLTEEGDELAGRLAELNNKAVESADNADFASRRTLPTEGAAPGVFQGKDEVGWLTDELSHLWNLRNRIIEADAKLRGGSQTLKKVIKAIEGRKGAIETIQDRIEAIKDRITELQDRKVELEDQLADADKKDVDSKKEIQKALDEELEKPKKKQNKNKIERLRAQLKEGSSEKAEIEAKIDDVEKKLKAANVELRKHQALNNAYRDPILETLNARATAVDTGKDTLSTRLGELQGTGVPMTVMPELPSWETGMFAGEIGELQLVIRDLLLPDEEIAQVADQKSISDLLEFAQAVRFGAFQTVGPGGTAGLAAAPFMGAFAEGGVALVGEQGPELAFMPHGTRVTSSEESAQMMNPTIYADIYIGGEKIDERVEVKLRQGNGDQRQRFRAGRMPI